MCAVFPAPYQDNATMNTLLVDDYLSVQEAAAVLRVHRSTIRRWIAQGDLRAYRVGQRKIAVKRSDLASRLAPARPVQKGGEVARIESRGVPPLTRQEQQRALAAVEAAKRLQADLLAHRGGERFSPSSEIIDQMRDARSQQLR
jgi:excisionase family DNA binding protein